MRSSKIDAELQELSLAEAQEISGGIEPPSKPYQWGYILGADN